LREDPVKGVCVTGVLEIMTTNVDEIMKCLRKGNRNRACEATGANETSSRSHAVLQIVVEHKEKSHGTEASINIAKFSLIDLAGSERGAKTNNRGVRLIEGANINRSLLSLGNCINSLCETAKGNYKAHIPYRDSKLTRMLKDSLGGNCRTVMIANVSPSSTSHEDTSNTLKYADRAK
jgi:kinesin family protein 18/19